jgi:hypothetical protein
MRLVSLKTLLQKYEDLDRRAHGPTVARKTNARVEMAPFENDTSLIEWIERITGVKKKTTAYEWLRDGAVLVK